MEIPQKSCFSLRGWAWRSNFKAFSIGKVHLFFTETWFFYQNKKKKAQLGGTPRCFFFNWDGTKNLHESEKGPTALPAVLGQFKPFLRTRVQVLALTSQNRGGGLKNQHRAENCRGFYPNSPFLSPQRGGSSTSPPQPALHKILG